jgi:hypothetical protein
MVIEKIYILDSDIVPEIDVLDIVGPDIDDPLLNS